MKYLLTIAIVAGTISVPAMADVPGRNWISRERVSHILARKGYHLIKIEADDGHWEGEATRKGVRYEFHADPRSGNLTKLKRDH
jgi:hypothetical protein